jgi:hypothetical protein
MFYFFFPQHGHAHGQIQQHNKNGHIKIATTNPMTHAPTNTNIFPLTSFSLFPNVDQSPLAASSINDLKNISIKYVLRLKALLTVYPYGMSPINPYLV